MADLSPAAQAVRKAAINAKPGHTIPAVLRAAADQVVPDEPEPPDLPMSDCNDPWNGWNARRAILSELLAIAQELEDHQ